VKGEEDASRPISRLCLLEELKVNLGVDANCFAEEGSGCGVWFCPYKRDEVGLGMVVGFAEGVDARKQRGIGVFFGSVG